MNAVVVLEVIRASIGMIKLLRSMQIDVTRLVELQHQADTEGRELTVDELVELADNAQSAIDALNRK